MHAINSLVKMVSDLLDEDGREIIVADCPKNFIGDNLGISVCTFSKN